MLATMVDGYVQAYGIGRQAERAYPELQAIRRSLLRSQVPDEAAVRRLGEDTRLLQERLEGTRVTFGITAGLPWLGRPVEAVRLGASAMLEAARAGELAGDLVRDLVGGDEGEGRVLADGVVNLELLRETVPRVEALARHVRAAIGHISVMPDVPFFDQLNGLKSRVLADAEEAARLADRAASGFRLLPSILGSGSPQTYFVALQNNADLRGTGGSVLAYAFLRMDEGRIELADSGSIKEVDRTDLAPDLTASQPPDIRWYLDATHRPALLSSGLNYSPQFPVVARAWAEQVSFLRDIPLDGVIAIDPHGVAYALKGQGSIRIPLYPEPIHSGNVVKVTEHDQYELPKPVQLALPPLIVAAAFEKLVDPRSVLEMGKHMATAFAEKRIQVWSSRGDAQALIEELNWDGGLDPRPGDFLSVTMNKRVSNKVDYFTRQEIDHRVTVLPNGDARAVTTVGLVNETPPGEAHFVTHSYSPYALNVSLINVHVPGQARSVELSPDEPLTTRSRLHPRTFLTHREAGTTVYTKMVEAWPGHPARLTYRYDLPGIVQEGPEGGSLFRMQVRHQPLARPADLRITIALPEGSTVEVAPAGWTIDENVVRLSGPLTRDFDAEIVYSAGS